MSAGKHTPWPWRVNEHRQVVAPNGFVVADVRGPTNGSSGKERREEAAFCDGNARLIAAAPRMFAVIEREAAAGDPECIAIVEAVNGRG